MNTTSSIKIFEERNTVYSLGEELRFVIPKNAAAAINPMQTYLTMNIEVNSQLHNAYALNEQAGAELLVKQLRILSLDGSSVFEEISDYNKLKRIFSYYGNNKTDDNLNQLFQGGQKPAPILLGKNKLFDAGASGTITQKKLPVQFKLSLSGLLGHTTRPFPNMLTGMQIIILLENDINNVLRKMGEYQIPRQLEGRDPTSKEKLFRVPGYAPDCAYQIALVQDKNGDDIIDGVADLAKLEFASFILLNTKGVNADGVNDDNVIQEANYQQIVDTTQSTTVPPSAMPFKIGQKLSLFKDDLGGSVEWEIGSVEASANERLKIGMTDTATGLDMRDAVSVDAGNFFTTRVAILEPGQFPATTGYAPPSTIQISNVELIVGTINLQPDEINKIQAAAGSSTGFQHDYQSYLNYPQNITKALVNSVFIPTKLNRTKSVITFYEAVGGQVETNRDNLLPIIDSNTAPSRYNYKLNNLIVPNRSVSLANLNKAPTEAGAWSSIHLHELQKALSSSISVRSLEAPNECFAVGRQLAVMNHTYDANSKGEMRLELNFSTQTRDLLIHNFIHHIRRLIVSGQGIMVEM